MSISIHIQIAVLILGVTFICPSLSHSTERNYLNYISVLENAQISTKSRRVHAGSKFDLEFDLHHGKQKIRLTLSPNNAVIQDGATVQYMAPDGSLRTTEKLNRSDYRVFMGDSWTRHYGDFEWTNVGWARIVVHRDGDNPLFEGAFRVDGDHHHIQTRTHFMQTKHKQDPNLKLSNEEYLVVWRDSDISQDFNVNHDENLHKELKRGFMSESDCSADGLSFNTQMDHPIFSSMRKRDQPNSNIFRNLLGRQIDGQLGGNSAGVNLVSSIGSTSGCPTTRKVALVGIATDCTYTAAFSSTTAARTNIINVINSASQIYESSFNITLGLQNLTISDASCPMAPSAAAPWNIKCSDSVDIQDRLNLFSAWRGERNDNNAYWTLLSTCGSGSAVGLAWLGQACVNTAQVTSASSINETVSGANVVVRTGTEWQVVAHETGHTFGAVHDCTSASCNDPMTVASQQCCPLSSSTCDAGGAYIMNPSTKSNIQLFSPCTIGNVCSAIGRNSVKTTCLTANKGITTITGSQCGNGIVEAGEDCDCGGTASCGTNPCCEPKTCKFKASAACDYSNEDCCNTSCQFASTGTICRASTGKCDPEEKCSGTNASCPEDVTAPDGTSCGNSLSCASGQCTSRDLQCKTLMGVFTQGNDTFACSSSGCQISCASPEFGSNVCYSMQQNFLDGTSCQGGGKCLNGQCSGSSVAKEFTSWIQKNGRLVIILASVIGGFLIFTLISCCVSGIKKGKRHRSEAALRANRPKISNIGFQNYNFPNQGWSNSNNHPSRQLMERTPNPQTNGWWDNQGNWVQQPLPAWQSGAVYR
ncbi:BgtASP-20794 [Blumeria graminis f. sp. tritici]|uniref:Disintegrin and metalloproteinase domain-containing protein B n=2 Tax=Blumeria graminis f. sp. tritici TaxID=62690 RepID=A0A9X9MM81_BLUGR|nr:hypothetical protein BGT96224_ASP20794 [Blumeria graminis f. sp. tritici 96224]VDB93031.1 BgtASP-20794 [Blumeria graminis f. sp. tritici]